MHWRQSRSEFEEHKGESNRQKFHQIVQSGAEPGLLAYNGNDPIGWVAVAAREQYPLLEKSRVLAKVDDQPVWSVVCFFIAKGHRRQGVSKALLNAAIKFVRDGGAKIIEGYPVPPKEGGNVEVFSYTGLGPIFAQAGFEVVVRRGKAGRGVWRKYL